MGTSQEITATFSEAMNSGTILAPGTFTVTGPMDTPIAGTVSYDAANNVAIFAVTGSYPAGLQFTATITTAAESVGLLPLASNYVWTFTTGAGPDTTPPLVSSTNPVASATSVGTNQKIVAAFDKGMDSTTVNGTTFTVLETVGIIQVPVPGVVTYSTIGDTATFTPSSVLDPSATFTATITTGVTDLSGNSLANNFMWTFMTGTTTDTTAPTVTSTNPLALASSVGTDASVSATFSEAMDSSTLNSATFTVTGPGATVVAGKVSYDVPDQIVTFTPTSPLAASTLFTATLTSGVLDLSGNALANTFWTFTTGNMTTGQSPVDLGSASAYAVLAATTVTAPGAIVVNGDLGLWPGTSVTGFPPATVNGTTNIDNPAAAAAQADLLTAFDYLMNTVPPGATVAGNIGGTTPPPGVYTAASTLAVTSGNLTLDAQGDPNAVWIFQIGTALDVTTQVILANGAQASNVFWEVGSSATIDVGAVMQGNILALTSVTTNLGATLNGRALALNGAVTAGGSGASLPGCQ
ncbi:MAG: Ig-like domain-containing protein [Candidatus Binatus sp.]